MEGAEGIITDCAVGKEWRCVTEAAEEAEPAAAAAAAQATGRGEVGKGTCTWEGVGGTAAGEIGGDEEGGRPEAAGEGMDGAEFLRPGEGIPRMELGGETPGVLAGRPASGGGAGNPEAENGGAEPRGAVGKPCSEEGGEVGGRTALATAARREGAAGGDTADTPAEAVAGPRNEAG